MSLEALPLELKMNIASHLQLRDLIVLRSTSKGWQSLINNNLSLIRRARGNLLRLWDDTIRSPYFLRSRELVTYNLYDFDRCQYLAGISRGLPLPEEFELWVLEWPAKAVIGWTWPGLDMGLVTIGDPWQNFPLPEWKLYGQNLLSTFNTRPRVPLYVWDKIARTADGNGIWKHDRDAHLNKNGGLGKLHRNVADHDVGVAIPVWSMDRDWTDVKEPRLEYALVISGLGATYNFSVQPFCKQRSPPNSERYIAMHLDREVVKRGIWQNGARKERIIRGTSWVEWLRRQLKILENRYKRMEIEPVDIARDLGPGGEGERGSRT